MARGWESKAVESQQEAAARPRATGEALSSEARDRLERRRMLELIAAQTQAELRVACHAAHRDMLRLKLEAVQAELDALAP